MTARRLWRALSWSQRLLVAWWVACALVPAVAILHRVAVRGSFAGSVVVVALATLFLALMGLLMAVPPVERSPLAYLLQLRQEAERLRRVALSSSPESTP